MEMIDIVLRLGAAALAGAVLGLNRDLRGKSTGVRTLGLVGIGSALVVMAVAHSSPDSASRVIQGIVTGIGFLGAGVIVRGDVKAHVHGLTTAACVWLTACFGSACGMGEWRILIAGAAEYGGRPSSELIWPVGAVREMGPSSLAAIRRSATAES